jgi:hypothetical protein
MGESSSQNKNNPEEIILLVYPEGPSIPHERILSIVLRGNFWKKLDIGQMIGSFG